MTPGLAPGTGATGRQGGTALRDLLEAAALSPFITKSEVRDQER